MTYISPNSPHQEDIGELLRELRLERGLTQRELAARTHQLAEQSGGAFKSVNDGTISLIESGRTKNPRIKTLAALANALNVPRFLFGIGDEESLKIQPNVLWLINLLSRLEPHEARLWIRRIEAFVEEHEHNDRLAESIAR